MLRVGRDSETMTKRWVVRGCNDELAAQLADRLQISPITAQVILHRGMHTTEDARAFLQPELGQLSEPSLLPGIDAAVRRIRSALAEKQRILIYGDYDVDGITSTAVLLHFFRLLGVEADYYIPHRMEEGYGLSLEAVREIASRAVDLMITVDCGITATREIQAANAAGIDVIITDHHEPGVELPPACAVVNPKLASEPRLAPDLSGVGVVFKLAWAVAQAMSPTQRVSAQFRTFLLDAMALVALGTIADVVPLRGENRVLAKYGLQALGNSRNLGLRALITASGLGGKPVNERNVAFRLGPRLNAAGRLSDARLGVELLMTDSPQRAFDLASHLEQQNRERQRVQSDILQSARDMLESDAVLRDREAIVLASPEWHAGVVGIVAARIAELYYRPTVLIALDNGVGKGSARSIPGLHLYRAVERCRELLLSFGGHAGAAGLRIDSGLIPEFREQFIREAAAMMRQERLEPTMEIDADVLLCTLSRGVVNELERLAPFGQSNPQPVLAASGLKVAGQPRLVGAKGRHVSFVVRQGDTSFRVIGFGMADLYDKLCASGASCSLAFVPRINRFRGKESVELEALDVHFAT